MPHNSCHRTTTPAQVVERLGKAVEYAKQEELTLGHGELCETAPGEGTKGCVCILGACALKQGWVPKPDYNDTGYNDAALYLGYEHGDDLMRYAKLNRDEQMADGNHRIPTDGLFDSLHINNDEFFFEFLKVYDVPPTWDQVLAYIRTVIETQPQGRDTFRTSIQWMEDYVLALGAREEGKRE